jgi:hypothetical protein
MRSWLARAFSGQLVASGDVDTVGKRPHHDAGSMNFMKLPVANRNGAIFVSRNWIENRSRSIRPGFFYSFEIF